MILIKLVWEFMLIGFLLFGGGVGMISYIQKVGIQKGWLTLEQFADMIALSQVTPGPIAINIATYVGFNVAGVWGAILSTLALVIPSMILVFLVIKFFTKYMKEKWMRNVLDGLSSVVIALVVSAVVPLFQAGLLIGGRVEWLGLIPLAYAVWASLNKRSILIVIGITGLWGMIMM